MSDIVMFLMSVMFLSIAKRIYLMSFGHQHLLVTIYTSTQYFPLHLHFWFLRLGRYFSSNVPMLGDQIKTAYLHKYFFIIRQGYNRFT